MQKVFKHYLLLWNKKPKFSALKAIRSKTVSAAPEINNSISLLGEDTCWTALIVPSSLSAASRYASPIVCLFLFCPLKYGHKFTKGTCSPRPRWGTITQWKNIVKISKGSAVRRGRGINRVMISPEFRCHPKAA